MTSIITGDIINSRRLPSAVWMEGLKALLQTFGASPAQWEIYRGDEFQLEVPNPEDALRAAIQIKAFLKTVRLDARMSIGIGEKTYHAAKLSESNGSAFVRSGELFETLKKQKITLAVHSGVADFDATLNLMLRLGLTFMNQWLVQSAEFTLVTLEHQTLSQEELGQKLGINQAAVSRRRKRAHFDLVLELDAYYRQKTRTLTL